MKKYPFSKKTVAAMLAASVAISPIVSIGDIFEADKAEAAEFEVASTATAVTRLKAIYAGINSNPTYEDEFRLAKAELNEWESDDWEDLLPEGNKMNAALTATGITAGSLAKEMASIAYSSNPTSLEADINSFITGNGAKLNTALGLPGAAETILAFLVDAEKKLWNENITQLLSGTSIKEVTIKIKNDLVASNSNYSALNTALKEKFGFGIEGLFTIKDNVNSKLELANVDVDLLRVAFLSAALSAGNPVTPPPVIPNPGGGSSGGGGTPTDPGTPTPEPGPITLPSDSTTVVKETNASGVTEVVTKVSETKVTAIVNQITEEKSIIPLKLETPAAGEQAIADIPASLFTEAATKNENAVVEVQAEGANYRIPVSSINVADLAAQLGVSASDVRITISVNTIDVPNETKGTVSKVVQFTVKAVVGDREVVVSASTSPVSAAAAYKEEIISTFSSYAEGDIIGETNFDADHSTAVRLNEDGTFNTVPTLFDGKTATFKTLTNGNYVILENDKTFTDVNNGKSWAEAHIEKLASKYIIKGKTDTLYAPKSDITRGEFALLISRSLGLVAQDSNSSKFPDVQANKGLNVDNEITAAYEAGFIQGFPDGTFRPNDKITRADASMIIARALEFTNVPDSKFDTTKNITTLKDNASFRYAKDSIEKVYQAGIMEGHETGKFGATEFTTREQMAKVIDKFLQVSNFIN